MYLTDKELATVLAALRYWQNDLDLNEGEVIDGVHFQKEVPLTYDEINDLCERLNEGDQEGGDD